MTTISDNKGTTPGDLRPPVETWIANLGHKLRVYKGQDLLQTASSGTAIIYIETGKAAITYVDARGCEMLVHYFYPGDFIDNSSAINYSLDGSFSVRALEACTLRRIPVSAFCERAAEHAELYLLLIRQVTDRLLQTTKRLRDLALLGINSRIANLLTELAQTPEAKSHPKGYLISTTRQELSRMAGCSRESAGKAIRNLQAFGFMEAQGKKMVVYTDKNDRVMNYLLDGE